MSIASTPRRALAAVAAGHTETAQAAELVLRSGGSAVDAAVAACFAAWVVEPVLASPGGGGIGLVHPKGHSPRVLDAFALTPGRLAEPEAIKTIEVNFRGAEQHFSVGMGTVAVPGIVSGLFRLHDELGRVPMAELAAPAIALATGGTPINPMQAFIMSAVEPILRHRAATAGLYLDAEGNIPEAGHVHANPALADFLDALSREGPALFYEGEIARDIDEMSDRLGGAISRADLASYDARLRSPLSVPVSGGVLLLPERPSAGGPLLGFGLKLLDAIDASLLHSEVDRPLMLRDIIRATAEVRQHATPKDSLYLDLDAALGSAAIERWRQVIEQRVFSRRGTTHISVVDGDGSAVALTMSNGSSSGELVASGGFMLNNMLGEEDLNPEGINSFSPRTAIMSMMSPGIAEIGDRRIVFGAGGSSRIRSALLQVLTGMIFRAESAEDAIHAPRLHAEGDTLFLEPGIDEAVIDAFVEDGSHVQRFDEQNFFFGGVHAVDAATHGVSGAGDPRRGGVCRVFPV